MPVLRSPGGQIVIVDDDKAQGFIAGGYSPVSLGEAAHATTQLEAPDTDGLVGGVTAGITSALSGATLGLSDVVGSAFTTPDQQRYIQTAREQHPFTSAAGNVAGALLPAIVAPESLLGGAPSGILGHAALEGVEASRAVGGATGVARALAYSGAEGAIQSAGMYLSDTALGDRELTAEGMQGALGTGFAFGAVGGTAALGIEKGAIAARRMFARTAEGTDKAAEMAQLAWEKASTEAAQANDAVAQAARTQLAEAQMARQQASVTAQRASGAYEEAAAGFSAAQQAEQHAWDLNGKISKVEAMERPPATAGVVVDSAPSSGGDVARLRALIAGPAKAIPVEEQEMERLLHEYEAARAEFDTTRARVEDPALEAALGGLSTPGLQTEAAAGVPVGEFGAPGERGIKSSSQLLPRPVTETGTPVVQDPTRALKKPAAFPDGTPTSSHDLTSQLRGEGPPSGTRFDPETRTYHEAGTGDVGSMAIEDLRKEARTLTDQVFGGMDTPPLLNHGTPEYEAAAARREEVVNRIHAIEDAANPVTSWPQPETPKPVARPDDDLAGLPKHTRSFADNFVNDFRTSKWFANPADYTQRFRPLNGDDFGALKKSSWETLSKPEKRALFRHSGNDAYDINKELNAGKLSDKNATHIEKLDAAIARNPAPRDLRVFRGIKESRPLGQRLSKMRPGEILENPAPTSTSVEPEPARRIGETHGEDDGGRAIVMVIDIPKGYPAIPIDGDMSTEREILLKRNTRMRLVSSEIKSGGVDSLGDSIAPERVMHFMVEPESNGFERVNRSAGGSQGGGWFRDSSGEHWFGKSYGGDVDRVEVEHLANRIYREFGVSAPETEIAEINGKRTMMSKEIKGEIPKSPKDILATDAKNGFVIDAWLANWDVLGQDLDNMLLSSGKAHRIDNGGSLIYRAQGDLKDFKAPVREMEVMRDAKRSAGRVFSSLTKDEVEHQLVDFAQKYDGRAETIDRMIDQSGLSAGAKREVKSGLRERAEWLKAEAAKIAPSGSRAAAATTNGTAGWHKYLADNIGPAWKAEGSYAGGVAKLERDWAAKSGGGDLESLLGGMKSKLDAGADLNAMGAPARAEYANAKAEKTAAAAEHFRAKATAKNYEGSAMAAEERASHPLHSKQLEHAYDEAIDAAHHATDPAAKQAHLSEAAQIDQSISKVSARPGAVEDVAVMGDVTTRYEKAAAALTEAMGAKAPPMAQAQAKAFREAEATVERKTMERTTRAIDDAAEPPMMAKERLAAAKAARGRARGELTAARANEGEARIGVMAAKKAAAEAKAAVGPRPVAPGPGRVGGIASHLRDVGTAIEVGHDIGIPGIPSPRDIPVIGPVLSAYLKYRAVRAAAGRFVGRVPATAEARAAALAARTKDKVAVAVDRSLGLAASPKVRQVAVATSVVLGRRLFDDGGEDAPKGASVTAQAAVRMREAAVAATQPDLVHQMVRKQTASLTDPDLISAIESHQVALYRHLADTAPKMPEVNPYMKINWEPSLAAATEWARRCAVVHDPMVAFAALDRGTLAPEQADTLRACFPKLFAMAQQRLIERSSDLKEPVPYQARLRSSLLFSIQLDSSLQPEHAAILASAHAKPAPSSGPPQSAPPIPSIAGGTNLTQLYQPMSDRRTSLR